jgi:hypothetical protein
MSRGRAPILLVVALLCGCQPRAATPADSEPGGTVVDSADTDVRDHLADGG